jgi:hypothetical protein
MQYVCWLGHGSRNPNASRDDEFAEREASRGE